MLGGGKKVCIKVFKGRSPGQRKKENSPSWEPGPWAGTICHTSGGEIVGTMPQEKWEKTRALVTELADTAARAAVIQEQECKVARVQWCNGVRV